MQSPSFQGSIGRQSVDNLPAPSTSFSRAGALPGENPTAPKRPVRASTRPGSQSPKLHRIGRFTMLKIRLLRRLMASPLQRRLKDRDDGLAQTVGQLARVKRRINSLAAQQLVFSILALLIGTAGLLTIAAFLLNAARFLTFGVLLAAMVLVLMP